MSVSLKRQNRPLADSKVQLQVLQSHSATVSEFTRFSTRLASLGYEALRPKQLDILQMNLGKMCNQTCKHCHVDAGPDRREIMTQEVMRRCVEVGNSIGVKTYDLTGGAPEMNPHFRWLIEEIRNRHLADNQPDIIDRCNLTIIRANPQFYDLPTFFANHKVIVVSSLPFYERKFTDRQRGDGVFAASIQALQELNRVGYGQQGTGLVLNLVYNPSGAYLPAAQHELEQEFREALQRQYDIVFSNLFALTNLPISRFLDYLLESNNFEGYMRKLINAFNPAAVEGLMCRNTLSVGWDGILYDCDFNQMLELPVAERTSQHISTFSLEKLQKRAIVINQHCYGCTAGAGSSCGGALIQD